MSPPPATPAPTRFLLPKRATQTAQTPTTDAPQFLSTPRFELSSGPRPTQKRGAGIEDVEEPDWCSESDVESDSAQDARRWKRDDSIEADPETDSPSRDGSVVASTDGSEAGQLDEDKVFADGGGAPTSPELEMSPPEPRRVKRRRLSVSPEPLEKIHATGGSPQQVQTFPPGDGGTINHLDKLTPGIEVQQRPIQQPTFRTAPRFKPTETDPNVDGLPDAFSPQRRGVKYLPDGLAAELQGWLSEVKGWESSDQQQPASHATLRIRVDRVTAGRRMFLAQVRELDNAGGVATDFILAGEGRLTGLNRSPRVEAGSVVVVGQPVWKTELDGHVWTVACNWSVE